LLSEDLVGTCAVLNKKVGIVVVLNKKVGSRVV
jgi:hypothetical protein